MLRRSVLVLCSMLCGLSFREQENSTDTGVVNGDFCPICWFVPW